MSYLGMMEARLPPGFRFHPRDDELICDYLTPKIIRFSSTNNHDHHHHLHGSQIPVMMIDIDLNKCEPWDLPEIACVGSKEWYFFNLRDRKYATGQRTNRATMSGYWKATGKDRPVSRLGTLVGMRKTLVFYQGRAPKGKKSDWVMHEFRLEGRTTSDSTTTHSKLSLKEDWVLCRVFYKSRGAVGMTSKPTSTESSYTDTTNSSPLPPLTTTYIDFDQTFPSPPPPPPPPLNVAVRNFTSTTSLEQVPCFSNYSQNYTSTPLMERNNNNSNKSLDLVSSCFFINPLSSSSLPNSSCDKKVINSVLDHFNKLEGHHQQQQNSYLSESALSTSSVWYQL